MTSIQLSNVELSIIVACRNEHAHIRTLLDCVLGQQLAGVRWETIIADGMSDDGTREILESFSQQHPEIRVISNQGRIVSTGLNAALQIAGGNVIIRMDAHTRYSPDYCCSCLQTLEVTQADNVGGPALTEVQSTPMARAIAAGHQSPFSTGGAHFHDPVHEGFVDTVPYGCWRKETLLRLGGFDESLVRNQDDELNLRLVRGGGRVYQSPRIHSWYSPRTSITQLFRQYLQYGYWKVAVIRKHGKPASWRHLVPAAFVGANLLSLIVILAAMVLRAPRLGSVTEAVWLSILGAYTVFLAMASVLTAMRSGWTILLHLPLVFATYHGSYGLGFALGLLRFTRSRPVTRATTRSPFAAITR
jgi:cellulose synthase/poly-beta-1,6-N-acetylglucosamine synthase-like glycosyltransferase